MNSLNIIRHVMTAAIIVTLASGFVLPAGAADPTEAPSITVKFDDLNVSSPQGAAALYSRIRSAAKTVCLPAESRLSPLVDACVNKAIADAVIRVNRMELYGVYSQHNKPPLRTTLLSRQR